MATGPSSTPASKRIRSVSSDSDLHVEGEPHIFMEPHRPDMLRYLAKKDDYVHLFLPRDIAKAFTDFLTKTEISVSKVKNSVIVIDDENVDLKKITEDFKRDFTDIKTVLCEKMSKHEHSKYVEKLTDNDFSKFKKIRSTVTKWFKHCQHLENKLIKGNSATNRYCKLAMQFSPAVKSEELRDTCNSKLIDLRDQLESELNRSVIEEAITLTDTVSNELNEANQNTHDLFLMCKAFRTVILRSRDIAGKLIDKVPKGQFRDFSDGHNNHRNENFDNRNYQKRPYYNHYHSRTYNNQNFDRQFVNRRQYDRGTNRNRDQDFKRDYRSHYDGRQQHRRDSTRLESNSTYDDDFPRYNNTYKQKKQRYVPQTYDNDSVFDNERRPSFRNHETGVKWM